MNGILHGRSLENMNYVDKFFNKYSLFYAAVSPVPPAGLLSPTDFSPSVTPEPVKLTAKATKVTDR